MHGPRSYLLTNQMFVFCKHLGFFQCEASDDVED